MSIVGRLIRAAGKGMRETGQALDRLGAAAMGNYTFQEKLCRHRRVLPTEAGVPQVASAAFVAPNAAVIGNVALGDSSSVWYGAVVRGDAEKISIGSNTHIQDRAVVQVSANNHKQLTVPTKVGNNVTVGHGATLSGCTIGNNVMIGMGATVSELATVEDGAIVAAGAVVPEEAVVKSGEVWAGSPAQFIREVTDVETRHIAYMADSYVSLAKKHDVETSKTYAELMAQEQAHELRLERHSDYDRHIGLHQKLENERAAIRRELGVESATNPTRV
eukprot:TRINITY_DN1038_c0_g1_i2.p1 TRINITY_DN1038_c0_g1~~TRINITY_DN1038_c0_g1_i2.p1  ORF type:complete len:275 (+),score=61.26 TRINITY_DN1038_c0_g1_i2:275-1099(+)